MQKMNKSANPLLFLLLAALCSVYIANKTISPGLTKNTEVSGAAILLDYRTADCQGLYGLISSAGYEYIEDFEKDHSSSFENCRATVEKEHFERCGKLIDSIEQDNNQEFSGRIDEACAFEIMNYYASANDSYDILTKENSGFVIRINGEGFPLSTASLFEPAVRDGRNGNKYFEVCLEFPSKVKCLKRSSFESSGKAYEAILSAMMGISYSE